MGACDFRDIADGDSAATAFRAAVDEAAYMSGHGGYTGTIAEKDSYVVIGGPLPRNEALATADRMIDEDDDRIDDKWGPAGCIPLTDGAYLFFGWASS